MVEKKYKLIKLDQGFILVSKEQPVDGDFSIHPNGTIGIIETALAIAIFKETDEGSYVEDCKKIIASTFISELPGIDFNGFEEEFGIVSYHKLYNEDIKKYNISYSSNNSDTYLGFNLGFDTCLELNKDKLYTLDDLKDAFNAGNAGSGGSTYNRIRKYNGVDEYLQTFLIWNNEKGYLPKTEWDVEVEMTNWFENDYTIIMKLN